nr:unnamed protein product [Callosobruchus analis]
MASKGTSNATSSLDKLLSKPCNNCRGFHHSFVGFRFQTHLRVRRATCDIVGSISIKGVQLNDAACALHCIQLGKSGAHGLQLAISKTEIVVLTRQRRFPEPLWVSLNDTTVEAKCAVKYLGEIIDAKLTHYKQICVAAHKAAKMVASLSRLMPNIAGPKPSKRRTLMSVAHSIMLYGAEIWADALMVQKYRKCLSSAALRVACAYRTVSETAVLVVAGIPPIDLLATERKMLYHRRKRGEQLPLNIGGFCSWQALYTNGKTSTHRDRQLLVDYSDELRALNGKVALGATAAFKFFKQENRNSGFCEAGVAKEARFLFLISSSSRLRG